MKYRKKLTLTEVETSDGHQKPLEVAFTQRKYKPVPKTLVQKLIEIHEKKELPIVISKTALGKQAKTLMRDWEFDDIFSILKQVEEMKLKYGFTFKFVRKLLEESDLEPKTKLF